MGGVTILNVVQTLIMGLSVFYLGSITRQLHKLQHDALRRSEERNGFVNLLDGIIELKGWAVNQPTLMEALASHEFVQSLVQGKVIGDEKELMAKCQLFFRLERLYHLSRLSGIDEQKRRGLEREIALWLSVRGMSQFFATFCKESKAYSAEFIEMVDKIYHPHLQ